MSVRERLLAINLINKARDNPEYVSEVGIVSRMKVVNAITDSTKQSQGKTVKPD